MYTNKIIKIICLGFLAFSYNFISPMSQADNIKSIAEWSVLVYIQADNSLASFAEYNINDMQKGVKSINGVNVLVQWNSPNDNSRPSRYQILPGSKRLDTSNNNVQMGINPGPEIVDAMQWMQSKYPAKYYGLILWNHGSGIEDLRSLNFSKENFMSNQVLGSWIQIPGIAIKNRGILYDDTTNNCLTNQALTDALINIKKMLGRNLDFLGMDACMMAMLEVGYQLNDTVNVFVGSQQTEPGAGWAYSEFLTPLTRHPSNYNPTDLAKLVVQAYESFYKNGNNGLDYTLSAVNCDNIDKLKQNIDQFIVNINACELINKAAIKSAIIAARNASIEFYYPEFIDMYSFYSALLNQINQTNPKSDKILNDTVSKKENKLSSNDANYKLAITALNKTIVAGMQLINSTVIFNIAGPQLAHAKGISIYFPKTKAIDSSYSKTLFAENTEWLNFILNNIE